MFHAVICTIVLNAAPAAADSFDELFKDMIGVMTEICDVMDKVKDKATAEENKDKLKTLAGKLQAIKERATKLGKPNEEEGKKLLEKHKDAIVKLGVRMQGVQKKLQQPEIKEALKDINLNPKL